MSGETPDFDTATLRLEESIADGENVRLKIKAALRIAYELGRAERDAATRRDALEEAAKLLDGLIDEPDKGFRSKRPDECIAIDAQNSAYYYGASRIRDCAAQQPCPARMDWQPISSAPKHQRVIVLQGDWVAIAIDQDDQYGWERDDGGSVDPTHWTPLPPPIKLVTHDEHHQQRPQQDAE